MNGNRVFAFSLAGALMAGSVGCAPLASQPTQREQTAAVGGLTGGAAGAIIGSMTGGAVTGGLFGVPIGAVAGYYIGDQMAQRETLAQTRIDEGEKELERLRRENQRLRSENGGTSPMPR